MPTNSIDIGKPSSERQHGYRENGLQRLQNNTAGHESDYSESFAEEGGWSEESSSFTLKVDPSNNGLRPRRRINQAAYNQELKV